MYTIQQCGCNFLIERKFDIILQGSSQILKYGSNNGCTWGSTMWL